MSLHNADTCRAFYIGVVSCFWQRSRIKLQLFMERASRSPWFHNLIINNLQHLQKNNGKAKCCDLSMIDMQQKTRYLHSNTIHIDSKISKKTTFSGPSFLSNKSILKTSTSIYLFSAVTIRTFLSKNNSLTVDCRFILDDT